MRKQIFLYFPLVPSTEADALIHKEYFRWLEKKGDRWKDKDEVEAWERKELLEIELLPKKLRLTDSQPRVAVAEDNAIAVSPVFVFGEMRKYGKSQKKINLRRKLKGEKNYGGPRGAVFLSFFFFFFLRL